MAMPTLVQTPQVLVRFLRINVEAIHCERRFVKLFNYFVLFHRPQLIEGTRRGVFRCSISTEERPGVGGYVRGCKTCCGTHHLGSDQGGWGWRGSVHRQIPVRKK